MKEKNAMIKTIPCLVSAFDVICGKYLTGDTIEDQVHILHFQIKHDMHDL